jgi:hypothetical protein
MGATRESNWSGGVLAVCVCGKAAQGIDGGVLYANVSPGGMVVAQTIAQRTCNRARKRFRFGFMTGCLGLIAM